MKKHIPNIITLSNLTCGLLSIIFLFEYEDVNNAALFIFFGLFFDFFDGLTARLLKVQGELGKQLDSLADMVTFGVAPGLLMFIYLKSIIITSQYSMLDSPLIPEYSPEYLFNRTNWRYLPYIAFLIPLLSAVRLAKFNIATNQTDQFIGLPTPANAIFFAAIPLAVSQVDATNNLITVFQNPILIATLVIVFQLLLNANIPLIALKFKSFAWQGNEIRYIFILISLVVILGSLLISNVFISIPIVILLYLIISIINNLTKRKK